MPYDAEEFLPVFDLQGITYLHEPTRISSRDCLLHYYILVRVCILYFFLCTLGTDSEPLITVVLPFSMNMLQRSFCVFLTSTVSSQN